MDRWMFSKRSMGNFMGLAKFWKRSTQCHRYQATERGPSQHIAMPRRKRSGAACFKSSIDFWKKSPCCPATSWSFMSKRGTSIDKAVPMCLQTLHRSSKPSISLKSRDVCSWTGSEMVPSAVETKSALCSCEIIWNHMKSSISARVPVFLHDFS